MLLREEDVTFQRLETWKASKDPGYAVKKARIEHSYAIADREVITSRARGSSTLHCSSVRSDGYHSTRSRHQQAGDAQRMLASQAAAG